MSTQRISALATSSPSSSPAPAPARRGGQFLLLCFLLSWVPWAVLGLTGTDINAGAGQIVFALAASGPSFAALVLWCVHGRERIRGTGRPTWYGVVLGLVLGLAAPVLTAVILHVGDLSSIGINAASVAAGVGGPVGVVAYTLLAGPLAEEFGWRGYLQPRLRQRLSPAVVVGLLGVVWAVWHVPLFLLPGTGQHETGLLTLGGGMFFVSIIAFTGVIMFVTERLRGGVWAAVAAHAGFNAAGALVPDSGDAGAVLECVIMTALAIGVAVVWRSRPTHDST